MKREVRFFLLPAAFLALIHLSGCDNDNAGDPPFTPGNFTVNLDDNRPELTWNMDDSEVAGFYIERMESGGDFSSIAATVAPDATNYRDEAAVPDTTYTYRIAAYNDYGACDWVLSDEIRVKSESEIEVTDIAGTVLTNNGTAVFLGTWTQGSTATTVSLPVKNTGTSVLRIRDTISVDPAGAVLFILNSYNIEAGTQTTLDVHASTGTVGTNIQAGLTMQTNDETDQTYIINFEFTVN